MGQSSSLGRCACDDKGRPRIPLLPICQCADGEGVLIEAVPVDDLADSVRALAASCVRGGEIEVTEHEPEDAEASDLQPVHSLPRLLGGTSVTQEEGGVPADRWAKDLLPPQRRLKGGVLGMLRLDGDSMPALGDVAHPCSYEYDIRRCTVRGLTLELCRSGQMPPPVELRLVEAISRLDSDSTVRGITSDCGFMLYFQALCHQHTKKPVFLSPLAQLPALACACADGQRIAIFTTGKKSLVCMRHYVRHACGVDLADPRYVIVECQDLDGFPASGSLVGGRASDVKALIPGMVSKATEMLSKCPNVCAILMESTDLPSFSDALRLATGLPVYDAISSSNFFMSGVQERARLAAMDDARQKRNEKQMRQHISPMGFGQKIKAGSLGVLCLDCEDHAVLAGAMSHWASFEYEVFFRVVHGLTPSMCRLGRLTPAVEAELVNAVRYLDLEQDVSGLTAASSSMIHFQALVRRHTTKPVFLSPLSQLPVVVCAHAEGEHIALLTESAEALDQLREVVRQACGLDLDHPRFLPVSCSDVLLGASSGQAHCRDAVSGMAARAMEIVSKHPNVRAIVMESVDLPAFSDAVRKATGRPVYDAVTACNFFMSGLQDNPRFAADQHARSRSRDKDRPIPICRPRCIADRDD